MRHQNEKCALCSMPKVHKNKAKQIQLFQVLTDPRGEQTWSQNLQVSKKIELVKSRLFRDFGTEKEKTLWELFLA
jgi:hypothetical protein